jgi:hypothetical protein
VGAYEALWDKPDTSFKTLSEKFAARPNAVPSDFVSASKAREYADFVQRRFRQSEVTRFGVRVHGAGEYPQKLRDAAHPISTQHGSVRVPQPNRIASGPRLVQPRDRCKKPSHEKE